MDVTRITASVDKTIEFLRNWNLLKQRHICCGNECYQVKSKTSDCSEFKCGQCKKRYSIRTDSCFFDIHIRLTHLVMLIFLFATNTSLSLAVKFICSKVGAKSISLWFHFLRDVMSTYLVSNPIQLGGADNVVEIDETGLGRKRKYNRGAFRGSGLKWVLGIIDRTTKLIHVQLIPNRTRDVLLPIIEAHVLRETVIHTDEAPVYRILNNRGFEHYTVKHKETYVAPDGTHTNFIENVWTHLKNNLKQKHGVPNDKLPAHIDEFLYRWNRKNEGPIFEMLLRDMAQQNPL